MGNAMREIQGAYDDKLETMRGELNSYYDLKVTLVLYTGPILSTVNVSLC